MFFALISTYSIIGPLLISAIYFKRLPNVLKILSTFVFINLFIEIVNFYHSYKEINNMFVFHIYTYIEFAMISTIFYTLFKSRKLKIGVFISVGLFYLFSIFNLIYWESINGFNSNQFAFEAVLVFIYCIVYYTELMKNPSVIHLEKSPDFLLVSGYFLYFSGTFMLFISSKELLLTNSAGYWILNSILNILLNITYTVVLWTGRKRLS